MYISPMLLETANGAFDDKDYIYEPKADGHRLILSKIAGELRLFTRHKTDVTSRYPELHDVPIDGDVILDGELVCLDPETNVFDFELTMERFFTTKPESIKAMMKKLPVVFFVFDVLWYQGQDLRRMPLMQRKELLASLFEDTPTFTKTMFIEQNGTALFNVIKQRSMEGVVAKKKDSIYVSKRSSEWLKIINWSYDTVFISGFRKSEFGWITSKIVDGKAQYMGVIEFGVPPIKKKEFFQKSKQIVTQETNDYVYIEPVIQVKVKFRNLTRKGLLRSPSFIDFVA